MKRLLFAAWLVIFFAGAALAQDKPLVIGWGVDGNVPAEARMSLLHCAPRALASSGRFAPELLPEAKNRIEFAAALNEKQLLRGIWLYTETLHERPSLTVWLITPDGVGHTMKIGYYDDVVNRVCDAACELAWEMFDLQPDPAIWRSVVAARKAAQEGNYDAADGEYRRAMIITPHAYIVCREAGYMWEKADKPYLAFMWYDMARNINKRDYVSLMRIAALYDKIGDPANATAFYELALGVAPRSPRLLIALARSYLARDMYLHDAQAMLAEALELDPGNRIAIDELIRISRRNEDWAVSAAALQKLLDLGVGGDEQRELLAEFQARAGDYIGAAQTIEDLRTRHPEDPRLLNKLALLYIELGRYDEAEPILTARLQQKADDTEAMSVLAQVYFQSRRFADAVRLLERAQALRPWDQQIQRTLGKAYELNGDLNGAFASYEKFIEKQSKPSSDDIARYLDLAAKLGRLDAALTKLTDLMHRRSDRETRLLLALAVGKAYQQMQRIEQAAQIYSSALGLTRNDPRLIFALGQLALTQQNYDEAESHFRRLLAESNDVGLLMTAANSLQRAGRDATATDLYGAAYRRDKNLTLAGVLYLEGRMFTQPGYDPRDVMNDLHQAIKDDEERELLLWLELYYTAEQNETNRFHEFRDYALHYLVNRPDTRVKLDRWVGIVRERVGQPLQVEALDMLEVFGRRLSVADFSKRYGLAQDAPE